jgi:hypothetical protein
MSKCQGTTFVDFLKCFAEMGDIVAKPFVELANSLAQDSYVSGDQTTESYKCFRAAFGYTPGILRHEIPCDKMKSFPESMVFKIKQ